MMPRIALVGQPNTGKSTLFNRLTGNWQHTGNWSGKTVAVRQGICRCGTMRCKIFDLPGTYSLAATSREEGLARDWLMEGSFHGMVIAVDGSQLERSMYLLADLVGLATPAIVVVTMVDVARRQGKEIDFFLLQKLLGVPVLPLVATEKNATVQLMAGIAKLLAGGSTLRTKPLFSLYGRDLLWEWKAARAAIANHRTAIWLAIKLLEGDHAAFHRLHGLCPDGAAALRRLAGADTALRLASCRYEWIRTCLRRVVIRRGRAEFSKLDRMALHPLWGTTMALLVLCAAFAICILVAQELQDRILLPLLAAMAQHAPFHFLIVREALLPAMGIALYLTIFCLCLNVCIGILEDVGYLARIAYLFDGPMGIFGLQGRSILPFVAGFGCTIAAVESARTIDSRRQRLLTIATSWIIPCSGTWAMVGLFSSLFFGRMAIVVLLGLFFLACLHIVATAHIFGGKQKDYCDCLAMELPPYHRAHWDQIIGHACRRAGRILHSSTPLILLSACSLWLLLHLGPPDRLQKILEPIGAAFGLHWKLLLTLLLAIVNRECALGAMAILFGDGGGNAANFLASDGPTIAMENVRSTLLLSLTPPQALAFLTAFFCNIPCCAAIAATAHEVRAPWWTLRLCAYYAAFALAAAAAVYHGSQLLF
ncbi:MAG: ferrous iron transport protein B [Puniceicoccales bacterium]|jgi:ferrous iron transport protein B|nr:ferrous iron transport protein B [Puniceicoccales bacterium]